MTGIGLFIGGVLFGSVGVKALKSKEAKKTYSKVISYGLDAKDCIMETADSVKEGWDDVYADAKDMKSQRDAEKEEEYEIIEDASEEVAKPAPKKTTTKKTTAKKTTAKKTTAKKTTTKAAAKTTEQDK